MKKLIGLVLFPMVALFLTGSLSQAFPLNKGNSLPGSPEKVTLYFRVNRSLLEKDYLSNKQSLQILRTFMADTGVIAKMDSIIIQATASPEGSPIRNQQLSAERAAAVKTYLMWQYPYLDRNKIQTHPLGEDWAGLRRLVEEDSNVPYREKVLEVIDKDITPWKKDSILRKIGGGTAFAYISHNMLRYLRTGTASVTLYTKPQETITWIETEDIQVEEPDIIITPALLPLPEETQYTYIRPVAIKTNLLFDLATLVNAEIEVPVNEHFSIAGELMFPWWLWEKRQRSIEILTGSLEGRYWFKPSYIKQYLSLKQHNPLTGWFVGIYTSMGKYDLEWNQKGYQGEIFLSGGLSFGYALPLNRNLNLEFSLSAGYLQTNYWRYQAEQDNEGDWHLIKQYPGTFRWLGPTKAKISLVWYPHLKSSKKGGNGR